MTANNVPLSENGSFEKVVNARTAVRKQSRQAWFTKSFRILVVLLSILLINIVLWLFQVIPSIPSIYVSEILTCAISFIAGRIYEKCYK